MNLPRIIGHRGAKALAPENTLIGVRQAFSYNVKMVEVDVKLSRDGVALIMHDDTLDRTTNEYGKVADYDWDEICQMDATAKFPGLFEAEAPPSLEEMLLLVRELDMSVNLEIKPCPGRDEETAQQMLQVLQKFEGHIAPDKILISSFSMDSLRTVKAQKAPYPLGLLIWEQAPVQWRAQIEELQPATLNVPDVPERKLTDKALDLYLGTGLPVLVYTVNEPSRAQTLFDRGVTSVFTDQPDLLASLDQTTGAGKIWGSGY